MIRSRERENPSLYMRSLLKGQRTAREPKRLKPVRGECGNGTQYEEHAQRYLRHIMRLHQSRLSCHAVLFKQESKARARISYDMF